MSSMSQMLAEASPWLHKYGYGALAVSVLFEGAGIPLPGAILMGGAALLAGQGQMHLAAVWGTAAAAAIAGDNLGFWIGHAGGRRLLLRAGVGRRRLNRLQRFYQRFGIWLLLFGRFFDGTRQLDGLVAGSANMPWPRFFIADAAGSILWVSVWVFGLYSLDRHSAELHRLIGYVNPWVAGVAVLAVLGLLLWLFRRGGDEADKTDAASRRD